MASNWAIVIGINDYQHHPERRLNYAVNDAQKMSNFLSNQAGFDVENVIQCLGDEAHRGSSTYPTCSNLLQLLERDLQPKRLGKVDRFWFYFSGHGVSHNGRSYLIPSDCLEDKIERFGLPIDEVIATLRLHQNADIVLILDACRQVLGRKSFDSSIVEQTISSAKERGITTIFSCDYGQYSYELESLQQGAFTYALIEGLAQYTLPNHLETYLRKRVPALNLQHGHNRVEQTPRIETKSTFQAFHSLLPDAVTSADIEVLVNRAKEAELEENLETAKELWWQVIEVFQSSDQKREARIAIDRIDKKIARWNSHLYADATSSQAETRQISEAFKASPKPPTKTQKKTSELSTLTTPVVAVQILKHSEQKRVFQIPELIGSKLQEFTFEIVEIDSYGKITSRHTGENQFITEKVNEVAIEMVVVPGGTFLMGSPGSEGKRYTNERPQHTVTVPAILMSKYPITFSQWKAVASLQPVRQKLKLRPSPRNWGAKRPVVEVSWHDAIEFCDRLSKETGRIYRLLTEAEWEYACRAGTTTPFHFGQTITYKLANYDGTCIYHSEQKGVSRAKTLQVGELKFSNAFGLFDMHGNVWEWCQDHWHESYNGAPINGEAWIDSTDNQNHVIRGGSWRNEPFNCRSSYRFPKSSEQASDHIGFRIVRSL